MPESEPHMSRRRIDLLVVIGLSAAGLATGLAYIHSGWMSRPLAYLAPMATVWVAAAFVHGLLRIHRPVIVGRIAAGAAWVVIPVAAFALPLLVRKGILAREVAQTPLVEPDPVLLSARTDVVRYDRTSDYSVYYHTAIPYEAVCRFYQAEIPARGWDLVRWEHRDHGRAGRMVLCEFMRNGRRHLIDIGELTGDVSLPVHPVGGASVHVTPYPEADRPPAFLPRL